MSHLFEPLKLRDITLRNRIAVSPMCEYSSHDGFANQWHLVHLGSRAVGGAGLVLTEAIAVTADGRISPQDLGIWKDEHVEKLAEIVAFVKGNGAVAGTQLAHAGRKASTAPPWLGGGAVLPENGGWSPIYAPSAIAFSDESIVPKALSVDEIGGLVQAFARAAERSLAAGCEVVELHGAHGYLIHEFLSPLSNTRDDAYGGSFENRTRFAREVASAVRAVWPERLPLFARISATDWAEGGWDLEQSVELARIFKTLGVDLVDASSGGAVPYAKIDVGPGFQVPFAERIRRDAGIATGAVGMITEAHQADAIVREGKADLVLLARELLRDPYWPLRAAGELGVDVEWPAQYRRAKPSPRALAAR
jgi:2,4-dienoyl-CoA reductase-like NADH-dependent reductase (Old Yellow Enzyme family)